LKQLQVIAPLTPPPLLLAVRPETVLEVARQLIAIAGIVDGNYPGDSRIARELLDIAAVLTARVQAQS